MSAMFELEIEPARPGTRDATGHLHRQLRQAILSGRLAAGVKLPPTRDAPACFGVARNTLAEVYERLRDEGLALSRRGSGTYVESPRVATVDGHARADRPTTTRLLNPFWLRDDVRRALAFWSDGAAPESRRSPFVDFRPALVDARQFPHATFRKLMAQQLRSLERRPASPKSAQGNAGNRGLREAIAGHIALTRAVACAAGDVIVTAGAQQAFDLLARVLVVPGQTVVAVEDPGYPPMRVPFAAAGASIVPVGVDQEGLRVDDLPAEARIVCLCPSHQFPIGVTMSARRRAALLAFAHERGSVIVEDDYDGEFRLAGSPLPALRTLAAVDAVCYVGTFSKCMLPSLRLGFVVPPSWMRDALVAAKNCADWHCPTALQAGVASFIRGGHLARHVRRMREVYARRKQRLVDRLQSNFAGRVAAVPSNYGMHVCAAVPDDWDVEKLCAQMSGAGVALHGLHRYYAGAASLAGLVFGLGVADEDAIDRGVRLLRRAVSSP